VKPEQLDEFLQYRMKQARDTLEEAQILLDASAVRGTVNRAYYAMFYALLALLATRKLGSSRHSAALSLFDREFVKPGLFPRELSRSLHLAFERRQTHDYGELVALDRGVAQESLDAALEFVAAIEAYLRSIGYLVDVARE
jgi:uncharacterized protein (UPF0332 family)